MARIRSIKPEFFRHELLQDLESSHPNLKPMLVFAGIWGQCDKNGIFEYKPRQLKLDILPFLEFDLAASLMLLRKHKVISLMNYKGKAYGFIPTFKEHQRISGTEAKASAKYPDPGEMVEHVEQEATGKHQGSGEERGEGKGREGNGVGEGNVKPSITNTEKAFSESFDSHIEELQRLFPQHDYEVEKATCLAHYRLHPQPIDPYVVIVKWFRRAEPKKPPPAPIGEYRQTEADLRAKGLIE